MAGLLEQLLGFGYSPAVFDQPLVPPIDPAEEARGVAATRLRSGVKRRLSESDDSVATVAPGLPGGILPSLMGRSWGQVDAANYPEQDAIDPMSGMPMPKAKYEPPAAPVDPWKTPVPVTGLMSNLQTDAAANDLPPSTNDPASSEPVVFQGGVPVPRPRPVTPSAPAAVPGQAAGPTDLSGARVAAGAAAAAAPAAADPMSLAPPSGGSMFGGIGDVMGKLFKSENAPLFLALGGGLSGAPSFGTGMRRASAAAVAPAMQIEQNRQKNSGFADTYRALVARGANPQEVIAAQRNPEMMKALVARYMETKPIQVTDGVAWRENPDGTIRTVKDFGSSKAPSVQEFKTPEGEVKRQWNAATKAWEPIPGFEKPSASRDQKLSFSNLKEITETGGKLKQLQGFHDTFKDQYGGYVSETVGDAANTWGRSGPWASADAKDRATWWQNYQSHKNVVRNELFGSALTKNEQSEYLKADIHPGMQPDVIKRNLERQAKLVETGIRRLADSLVEAGYSKNAVYKGFGIDDKAAAPSGKTKSGLQWSIVE